MLKQSSLMLMARLRFYRALFGAETREINTTIISDYLKTWGQKITFEGVVQNRLQLSMVAVGILMLVQGGHLVLKDNQVTLTGDEISMRSDFQSVLADQFAPITPDTVEAHWLVQQLKEKNNRLKMIQKSKKMILEIV